MFERFTDRARRVVVLAEEAAKELQHDYIGAEHLLIAMALEGEGIAAQALERHGLTSEVLHKEVLEVVGPGTAPPGAGHLPSTSDMKKVLELALREALRLGHSYIGTEHILLGLIRKGKGVEVEVLSNLRISLDELRQTVLESIPNQAKTPATEITKPAQRAPSPLEQLGRGLTELARDGVLDRVVGRAKEIDRLIQVLSRRTRHNPVLVGEHGVGRAAVFDGLAQRIVAGEVPERLKGKAVHALDRGGHADEELREAMAEVRTRNDVILLLDDISDPVHGKHAEILSAAVLHGDVLVGCTATPESYRRVNAESPALAQLFQPIQVVEMAPESAVEVLRVMRGRLVDHHRLTIEDDVLAAAVELAARYDRQHRLPRSAIDLIDEACARAAGTSSLSEADLSRTIQDLRNEWKVEAQLLGVLEPAHRGRPARPVPEAFLQVYGGVDTEIWRVG
ncbi:Clp protease N-terminal domain-containing protein [Amycolatopsis sp. NPDC049159]|uniref:Clp protease N-terminal domain-containing protein n=1 Tax=Amycolatopsis sp. NPDC049159 TaxID=3157210 RepID=UPI0033CB819E